MTAVKKTMNVIIKKYLSKKIQETNNQMSSGATDKTSDNINFFYVLSLIQEKEERDDTRVALDDTV